MRPVPPGISLMCPTHTLPHCFPIAYLPSPACICCLFHAAPQHRHRRGPKNIKVYALYCAKAQHVRRHTWSMFFDRSQAVIINALAPSPALPGILWMCPRPSLSHCILCALMSTAHTYHHPHSHPQYHYHCALQERRFTHPIKLESSTSVDHIRVTYTVCPFRAWRVCAIFFMLTPCIVTEVILVACQFTLCIMLKPGMSINHACIMLPD